MPGGKVGVSSEQLGPLILALGLRVRTLEYKKTRYFQFIHYFLI